MSTITSATTGLNAAAYNLKNVQDIVSQSTVNVAKAITLAVMDGLRNGLDFKALAERNINPSLAEDLSMADEVAQMLFHKLFAAANEFCQGDRVANPTLAMIGTQTGNGEAPNQFLGTFVWAETPLLRGRLEQEEPASLANQEIWSV